MTLPVNQIPKTAEDLNCFGMEVERDLIDVEIVVEIVHVEPPDPAVGIFGRSVEIEAWTLDGCSFSLTESEHERAIDSAIEHMERWAADSEK